MANFARPYIGLIPVFLLVALLVGFGLFTGHATLDAQTNVDHASSAIRLLDSQLEEVLNAESGQRGYLLTEDQSYLAHYDPARQSIAATTDKLKQAFAGEPEQLTRLRDLQTLIFAKLDELGQTVTLARAGHRDEAIAIVRSDVGANLMLKIRQGFSDISGAEKTLLAHRQAEAAKTGERVKLATYAGAIGAALSALFLFMTLSRDQRRRAAVAKDLVRLKDEAQAANRAKSDFLATMSHEIRTPMNGIIGMNGLLLDTALDTQQEQFAKGVQVSAEALLKVVNDILDISKLEAGRVEVEAIDYSPAAVIEAALDSCAIPAQRKGLEIAALIDPRIPAWVRGDPTRLRQVILNLIGNALKFTTTGYIGIELSAQPMSDGAGLLKIIVADTGTGIPDKAREQLFQKFIQADSSITRRYGGTGLGLAISRQLVTLMGGQIGVDSTVGEGARFWFTVRYDKAQSDATATTVPQPTLLKGRRVVVVDDTDINRRAIAGQLASYGIDATTLAEPSALLATLRAAAADGKPFDVAILDQNMPDISGTSLARLVRALPAFKGLKLILATSIGLPNPSDDSRHVGFDDFLAKPLKRATLIDSLCRVLGLETVAGAPAGNVWANSEVRGAESALRILVAEDNPINQQLVRALLEKWGHKVTLVENGFAAVTTGLGADFDIILMDIQMPGMSGIEAAMRIRGSPGPRSEIPIIALTAHVLAGVRDDVRNAGIQAHVMKPIDPAELTLAINRLTGRSTGVSANGHELAARADSVVVADNVPVLDADLLTRLEAQIGRKTVVELAEMLREETPVKLTGIHRALEAGDVATVRQYAHDISSTAGNLGATALGLLARQLEKHCENGLSDSLRQLARAIDNAYHAAAEPLRQRYG